ncbi:hypothetical protein CWI42_021290 [Ordospora colligata]|uniref:NEDD8-activating enzyme E1 catalytic subunit n=1 Tax=Ordospora colligata OC4 TaxID=1354746 RepID=A0A0B2UMM6_9MICR|nr:uncharacterized protein M896_021300 [Ordospora colligata OC4]KHN70292.1 hypothetical protein M896_021300 [Ordospora colligata OC4]TBU16836.1 hypothetical protein CWI41_021310 [Ordospora colligata]TBU16944.1 hypothetical protein CWI40_021310 [Ordospora colligata]TBU19385.1 hypothetical protein CWI42_021290 [Ordospora colligata]
MNKDKVLVVGCGGIGCELLKLLSRENIRSVTMIDCDIIELSNLNRQFFFTHNDVGKSKAVVAASIFARMCTSECTVQPICARIEEFDACFFAEFDMVYCCLDNVAARVYVNQRCVFSSACMIDAGSGGFKGQAYYFGNDIVNGSRYECFDCIPRGVTKEHAVCTIRSRPSCFEHCIVWAKHVFLAMKIEVHGDPEQYYYTNLKSMVENCECTHDALDLDLFRSSEEYAYKVRDIMKTINAIGIPEFNKDDKSVLELVYNVAFIRAKIAGIEPMSFDNAVTVAGSIIPSISTANSIIASLMILCANSKCNYYLVNNSNIIRRMERCVSREGCPTCSLKWYVLSYSRDVTFKSLIRCFRAKHMELQAFSDADVFLTPAMKDAHDKKLKLRSNSTVEVVCSRNSVTRKIGLYIMKHDRCMSLRKMDSKIFTASNRSGDACN